MLKNIETKTVITKVETHNERNVLFLQNSPLGILHIYFTMFSICRSIYEIVYWRAAVLWNIFLSLCIEMSSSLKETMFLDVMFNQENGI